MSVIGEDILGKKINKKRALGIVIIAILLISMFAFSTVLLNLLFGTQRSDFNDSIEDKEEEDAPPLTPYFPWEDFNVSDILPEDLEDLLDMLSDLLDGDSDDLDLSQFSEGLMALLASAAAEMEVFRVYNYSDFNEMDAKLWKYECYDQYTGTDWSTSVPMQIDDFYTLNNYTSQYWYLDLLKIKIALSPNASEKNSLAFPSLFPIPFIIKESIDAINNLSVSTLMSTTLYKNLFNVSKADLFFSSNDDVNMTYNLFGLDLRSNDDINSRATTVTNPTQEYLDLLTMFTQIPPNLQTYLANNLFFEYHYNILNNTIINENDNAFVIANKIRNYLQTNFYLNYIPSPDPGRDAVDWFCEQQQGLWPDFASAFTIFSRAFGVASRFVTGFNSRWIESFTDYGEETFAIKYKNLYNWAEIFVPFNIFGGGEWVQMDILFDSYGPGGSPMTGDTFNITVTSDQSFYNRTKDEMKLTATLIPNGPYSVANRTITFTDRTSNQILGVNDTDVLGITKISVQLNDSYVVGPHIIEARYDVFSYNYNVTVISGDIAIDLTSVSRSTINRSDLIPDETNVGGYVYDPVNDKRVKDAQVNFILLQKNSSIEVLDAFIPQSQITGNNGEFDTTLTINSSVPSGQYEIRVDFNGTWVLYGIPYPIVNITNISNTMDLNITKALSVWFYINNTPSDNPDDAPFVSRGSPLNLTAKVILENFGPKPDKEVFFYDYSQGGIEIGNATSDANGIAFITYNVDDYCLSGPNLLFARLGIQENYSYFIVDESPTIHITSGPTPRVINRTGGTFNIIGNITDYTNSSRLISFSEVTLRLLSNGFDNSSYLVPFESYPYQTGPTGTFNLTFGVDPNTPTGNYTLRMDFYGTIDLTIDTSHPYPHTFNLTSLSSYKDLDDQLKIETLAILYFDFWINGYPSYDINNPIINRYEALNLSVLIQYDSTPIPDGEWVDFYDVTQETPIDSVQTISGYANASYPIDFYSLAGPHLIYAKWKNNYHYSYFILNAPIDLICDVGPQPREIQRSGEVGTTFNLHGYVIDFDNLNPIKYAYISVHLYDGTTPVSHYLIRESGYFQLDETGEFNLTFSVQDDTPDQNYTIEIEFNGIFTYSSPYNQFNEHNFYLPLINFSDIVNNLDELKVIDPENLDILLAVEWNPTLSYYNDINPPEVYNLGEMAHFQVWVIHGLLLIGNTVTIYDDFTGNTLDSYTFDGSEVPSGFVQFNISTATLHAGLHKVRVNYHTYATFNTTYIIINKTITINSNSNKFIIQRDVDNFRISGTVLDGTIGLRGLRVKLLLLDKNNNDVSNLIHYSFPYQQYTTLYIDGSGNYQFEIDHLDINLTQGIYYIRIDFNGSIDAPGIFLNENDFMVNTSSSLIQINTTAGTIILKDSYYTEYDSTYPEYSDRWIINDTLYVVGTLTWDNGSVMAYMYVNVTIKRLDGTIIANYTVLTDSFGVFNASIFIDINDNWPDFRNESEIWVYFSPSYNNLQNVEMSINKFN